VLADLAARGVLQGVLSGGPEVVLKASWRLEVSDKGESGEEEKGRK
jgi:hypothetical protein